MNKSMKIRQRVYDILATIEEYTNNTSTPEKAAGLTIEEMVTACKTTFGVIRGLYCRGYFAPVGGEKKGKMKVYCVSPTGIEAMDEFDARVVGEKREAKEDEGVKEEKTSGVSGVVSEALGG